MLMSASRGVVVARMPAGGSLALLADVPDRQGHDGSPQLVIRGKDAVVAMPVFPRRRHEIREPVEKLKRREFDNAIGPWPRGLPRASRAEPVGGFVTNQNCT